MNFLEICQKVDVTSGIQGMIQNVQNIVGAQEVIVHAVRDGFIDLQEERMTWEFMRRTIAFTTQVDKKEYTNFDIFGAPPVDPQPTDPYDTFGRWQKLKPLISYRLQDLTTLRYSKMVFVDFREFRHHLMNQVKTGTPRYVTANEQNNNLLLHPTPDKAYSIEADYFVEPQILNDNANVPILPSRFHQMLVYRGLDRVGNFYGNNGLYQRYAVADAKMTGNLYRDQVPAEAVVIRAVA